MSERTRQTIFRNSHTTFSLPVHDSTRHSGVRSGAGAYRNAVSRDIPNRIKFLHLTPKQMYFIVLLLLVGATSKAAADFFVTVSSNEAQHILI
jgi:hypothetical protein